MAYGFNDKASSVTVSGQPWEICDDIGFRGHCIVLRPGDYPTLREMGMGNRISSARQINPRLRYDEGRYAPLLPTPQITLYDKENFQGRTFNAGSDIVSLQRFDFNDKTSSLAVTGGRWEVCEDSAFHGRCIVVRPGRYATLHGSGLDNRISSVRLVQPGALIEDARYAPLPVMGPAQWQPRPEEAMFQAPVVSSRAVYATGQQNHCWVSHDEVTHDQQRDNRLGGAVIGGLLGGIIGHQIGDSNAATVGGALGGAAVGAAIGNNVHIGGQDVQHCEASQVQGPPEYWDTTYNWKGVQHHVQTSAAPGTNVSVNEYGEPRGK
jgi:uncharacterized protein YcfJ